jgi:hypothetical protein
VRRRTGIVLVALLLGALAWPSIAHAAPGGAMTASNGTFIGTVGDDLRVIGHDGDLLSHNRFAAGDPGFASATDFDSSAAGVQTKPVGNTILQFDLGAGADTVRVVGTMPNPVQQGTFGDGANDTLDLSDYASGAQLGATVSGSAFPGVERIIGTDYADTLVGTEGNDVLDGGPGDNTLSGGAGDDTLVNNAPFPATRRAIDTSNGHDTVVFRGTAAADDIAVIVEQHESGPQLVASDAAHPDGGYNFDYNPLAIRVELGDGDDSLLLDALAPTVVDGGDGNDDIAIDAHEATATVTTDAGDKLVTLPSMRYFADGSPVALRLAHTQNLSIFDETVIATAPGAGGGPHVRTWRTDGTPIAGFMAYAPTFTGGVSVALGDLDGDGDDEVVTGPGPGGGPHVRVFHSDGTDTGVGFMAYDPKFTGGVNVAAIDLDGDQIDEIVTVPALGGGPHVRIWSGDGELLDEFMADGFGNTGLHVAAGSTLTEVGRNILLSASSGSLVEEFGGNAADLVPYPGFGGGASVTGAEIDAPAPRGRNGYHDEIVTAAGPGGGPHVKVFESSVSSDNDDYTIITQFMAYDPNFHGGVDVATCNPDGLDDEVVTAPGAGGGPHVRMFNGKTGAPMALSFMAYDPTFTGGVRVACGGAETKQY